MCCFLAAKVKQLWKNRPDCKRLNERREEAKLLWSIIGWLTSRFKKCNIFIKAVLVRKDGDDGFHHEKVMKHFVCTCVSMSQHLGTFLKHQLHWIFSFEKKKNSDSIYTGHFILQFLHLQECLQMKSVMLSVSVWQCLTFRQ